MLIKRIILESHDMEEEVDSNDLSSVQCMLLPSEIKDGLPFNHPPTTPTYHLHYTQKLSIS